MAGATGNFGVNQVYFKALRFVCPVADRNYALPSIPVPEGMELLLRGWPTNGGIIYVTGDSATLNQVNNSYPLLANETLSLRIQDACKLHVAATVAGEFVVLAVEYASQY
jgi:hypothetical protein